MKKFILPLFFFFVGSMAFAQLVVTNATTSDGTHIQETVCFNRTVTASQLNQEAVSVNIEQAQVTTAEQTYQANQPMNAQLGNVTQ